MLHVQRALEVYHSKFGAPHDNYAAFMIQTYTGRNGTPFATQMTRVESEPKKVSENIKYKLNRITHDKPEDLEEFLTSQKFIGFDGKPIYREAIFKDGDVVQLKDGRYNLTVGNVFFTIVTIIGAPAEKEAVLKKLKKLPEDHHIANHANGVRVFKQWQSLDDTTEFHHYIAELVKSLFDKKQFDIHEQDELETHTKLTAGISNTFRSEIASPNPSKSTLRASFYPFSEEGGKIIVRSFDSPPREFSSVDEYVTFLQEQHPTSEIVIFPSHLVRYEYVDPDAPLGPVAPSAAVPTSPIPFSLQSPSVAETP